MLSFKELLEFVLEPFLALRLRKLLCIQRRKTGNMEKNAKIFKSNQPGPLHGKYELFC